MYLDPHGPVVSATDLTRFLACPHVTELDLAALRGQLVAPAGEDELLKVLFARGLEHEHKVVAGLRRDGVDVVDIDPDDDPLLRTREAMLRGAAVIYQATFFDGRWRGHADFLLRRGDRPGRCGLVLRRRRHQAGAAVEGGRPAADVGIRRSG